jgi:hypothetical protein
MRAMVYRGPCRVRVEEKDMPRIEHPNDAILRVTSAAICGSDLHIYHGMLPDTRVGMTFGHEFVGVVEDVGPSVRNLKRVDRAAPCFNALHAGHVSLTGQPQTWEIQMVRHFAVAMFAAAVVTTAASAQAPARRHADVRDRLEDIRDRREDVRDRAENHRDRREDRLDRREDRRDARHDGGRWDRVEDRFDRREDVRDRAEDRRDRRENVRDRREDRRDRRR